MKNKLLKTYLKQVKRFPRLSLKQELYLLKNRRDTPFSTEQLVVESNLLLVVKIAMQYNRVWVDFDIGDLIQEGNIGLMLGVKKFDHTKKVRLSTFVAYWIKATIYDFIMWNSRGVTITKTKAHRKIFDNISKEKRFLESKGIVFDTKNVAEKLGVKERDLIEMGNAMEPMKNIDDFRETLSDTMDTPLTKILKYEREVLIKEQIDGFRKILNPIQFYIFNQRIVADQPKTQIEVAKILSTTQQNISEMERTIYRKAQSHFDRNKLMEIFNDAN